MKNEYRIPVIDMKATGQRIAQLRKERNLSVRDLQEIFGFTSPQAIYKWQWGESLPEIENLLLLAEIFETISATIRERIRIRNRVRTLTAQGRMQGVVLSLMPIGIGVALHLLQPNMFGPFLGSSAGVATVAAVAVLLALGALSIRRIVNIDI